MSIEQLAETALAMVAPGKGIIAIDESTATIAKRFAGVGIENTEENRRAYRELLLTTPKLNEYISGAILYDETLRQSTKAGVPFAKHMADNGIIPGIKVDKGPQPLAGFPGEVVTEGLDGLRARLEEYYKLGARFAKWRAVINIGDDIPSGTCIEANNHALARYAALCQEQGLVPMVEPEVIMDGSHDLDTCFEVTEVTLRSLFGALYENSVLLEGTILKASMVVPGTLAHEQASVDDVAAATLQCLKSTVPATLPGIVFLSGGQSDEDATAHLNAMNQMGPNPWPLSFSYGRAMQSAALKLWSQDLVGNYARAQQTVYERAKANGLAALGQWKSAA
ncbi:MULTISPECIES: class I fructose-bisphosphate aldolase [Lysobacter]|jgi:fructose-bisphosphate aldolase class I|uniref:Fructose-bisphosphate aldolase n=1 Tax=Lysobacter gummosus TaxID=262324 RepID=A0ABY3XG16_9GAMM|nr:MULTISPECIES: class I fructose-bisphosphate aldolase [Lysobacter]ALN89999.1 fructose-bisphosphate aldolase [Lysobacter gummosus]UJB18142.1 fructose-bisphosphate aldolase class I [Lysobacter capsici]UJQ28135.1 fructose-bisphosphate aldolase class I [Lysobacter gummosus]UNP30579.1 fructose-bisphosphate aldolase class I [Lysobacter gummosus]